MLAYTRVTSPYDGLVTVRNANTGDYVQAITGDKSTTSPSAIFVVARTDILRIFIDVPERYARYVQQGTKAAVRGDASSGFQISATVTRTSWAIRERTRTLWTEIDLSRQDYDGLRPGMYAYASVFIERPSVYARRSRRSWSRAIKPTVTSSRTTRPSRSPSRPASATEPGLRSLE